MKYAKGTDVSVAKSKTEIEHILTRFGASHFMYGWREGAAIIEFVAEGRRVRFVMKLPNKTEKRFTTRQRYGRVVDNDDDRALVLWEDECRQYWRALALLVKAKLAAVESGITSFESEFLSHIVVGKQSVGDWLRPQLQSAYDSGNMPPLLLGAKEDE